MRVDGRLAGRRIAITGGSSGIGLATARMFLEAGAKVAIIGRDRTRLDNATAGTAAMALSADVRDSTAVASALAAAATGLGGLDGLVCAAGINVRRAVEATDDDVWQNLIATNLSGSFYACRAALPYLRAASATDRQNASTIVTIATGGALVPPAPHIVAYAASKGGLLAMTKALAIELAPEVRANCILPGNTATPLTQEIMSELSEEQRRRKLGAYAMKRLAHPEEIASAILFLTSHEASYMTGASLSVDGGRIYH